MHYYKRNLGDYAKKTGRLSMLQHGAYTLLIDACYDRERFPTLEEAIEWTWASTKEEMEAVEFVLRRFFTMEDGSFVQKRIQEEIAEYHEKAETNKRIATEREAKRKAKTTEGERTVHEPSPTVNEAPPNHKPITKNQEPTIPPTPRKRVGGQRFEDFWLSWPKNERKQDKAKCLDHWKRNELDQLADTILDDVRTKRGTKKWAEGYVEAPLVYLRGKRWMDGVVPEAEGGTEAMDWRATASGIRAKGIEIGVGDWNEHDLSANREHFPAYRARVEAKLKQLSEERADPAGKRRVADLVQQALRA